MVKENYRAWEIKVDSFPEKEPIEKQIQFLLGFAILAPSAHNSQPWICEINSDVLTVFIDQARSLAVGDPEQRLLFIALGCFLENLYIAAEYFGFDVKLEEKLSESPILKMKFMRIKSRENNPEHLIFQIPFRRNNRFNYKDDKPAENIIKSFEAFSKEGFKIMFVSDKQQKQKLAEVIDLAQVESMESAEFRQELSHYFKSNLTKEKFGMPGFTLDMPAPLSFVVSKLVKIINISKLNASMDLKKLNQFTPTIGIISTKVDDKAAWLEAGRVLERLWLAATKNKLTCSIWAAAVQIPKYREEVKKLLNLESFPTVMFRIGYPQINPKPSPRLLVNDILKHAS